MRHILQNISVSLGDTLKNILRSMIASFGILFLISFFVMYLPFRDSVKGYIENNLFGKLNINEMRIYPRSAMEGGIVSPSAVINSEIPAATVRRLKAMPELENVYTVTKLNFKSKVHGELLGHSKSPHIPICGIERGFFRGKVPEWNSFRMASPLPVIIPRVGLELFNNFLTAYGLPMMKERDMKGFPLQLYIFTPPRGAEPEKQTQVDVAVHAFSDAIAVPALLVPAEFIYDFARREGGGKAGRGYSPIMVFASARDVKTLPDVTRRIREMGLLIESQHDIANKTNSALRIIDGFSVFIIGILFVIIVISIFNSYLNIVYARSHKFSLQRMIGVSKLHIIAGFVVEAAVVGALYGVAGFFLGRYLLGHLSGALHQWIPGLSNITIAAGGDRVFLLAIGLSMLISAVAAFLPAVFASNLSLFKEMKK